MAGIDLSIAVRLERVESQPRKLSKGFHLSGIAHKILRAFTPLEFSRIQEPEKDSLAPLVAVQSVRSPESGA